MPTLRDKYLNSEENVADDNSSVPASSPSSSSLRDTYLLSDALSSGNTTEPDAYENLGAGAFHGAAKVGNTLQQLQANYIQPTVDRLFKAAGAKIDRKGTNLDPDTLKMNVQNVNKDYEEKYGNSTVAKIGEVGGEIATTAPLMPMRVMEGINLASKALPTISATGAKVAAPLINRLGAAVGTGGVGGGVIGGLTSSGNDKSLGENVGSGVVSGMVGGPLVTGAGQLGKSIGGKVIGSISPTAAALAKRAEELGIDLKATQVSSSPLLKKFDQISGMLPFSGAQGTTDKQIGQFTKAVSRTFGEDTSEITPKVIADSKKKIGTNMENIYKSSTVTADPKLAVDLKRVYDDATITHVEQELRPVVNQIRNVISKIGSNGEIDGEALHGLIKYNGVLSKAQQSSNPNIRNSANEIRSALEKALDRSLGTDQKALLNKYRSQYKAAKTVEDLVDQSAEGYVSPLKLLQKVNKSPGGKLRSGELGELADIGRKFFPTPADSGTPLGETIMSGLGSFLHNPLSFGTAAGSALFSGATMADVASGGMGLAVNRLLREGVNSKIAREAIIRGGTGETHGAINKLSNVITPYSSEFVKDKDHPLKITVTK